MFDKLYEYYVNYRIVRATYQIGFFLFWADWARKGLQPTAPGVTAIPDVVPDVTWLIFGWLPAVFWPIQAIVEQRVPFLPALWRSFVTLPLAGSNYDVPWGGIVIVVGFGIFLWSDLRAFFKPKDPDEEANPSPAAGTF
jgi:hypothetical protein